MGKKKAGKNGKGKRANIVAGVKIPKKLRNARDQLAKLAREPLAREIAFAALTAGLAARKDARKAAKKRADDAGSAAEDSRWVSAALAAAALEAARRALKSIDEGKANGLAGSGKLAKTLKAAATVAGGLRH
jgi:hypothetical protein